ncbi:MAG: NAD(P)H-hydrate epimerase [Sedimentisphaerales bacterium]|nr:NAD(P)H-hydrate epimerase [Sedimentisphaerales bacterium]
MSGMEEYDAAKPKRVMSRDEVRAVDRWAIEQIGVPGVVLMENAGRSCAELVREKLRDVAQPQVCIFCGTGNNGGDGYVVARHLLNSAVTVRVAICGDAAKVHGDARINLNILTQMGCPITQLDPEDANLAATVRTVAGQANLVVDALFGTGLQGQLKGPCVKLIEAINALGFPVLSVDIPSGLDCDSGEPLGTAIRAAWTVTFVAVKRGFAAGPAASAYTGHVYVASIGVEPSPSE